MSSQGPPKRPAPTDPKTGSDSDSEAKPAISNQDKLRASIQTKEDNRARKLNSTPRKGKKLKRDSVGFTPPSATKTHGKNAKTEPGVVTGGRVTPPPHGFSAHTPPPRASRKITIKSEGDLVREETVHAGDGPSKDNEQDEFVDVVSTTPTKVSAPANRPHPQPNEDEEEESNSGEEESDGEEIGDLLGTQDLEDLRELEELEQDLEAGLLDDEEEEDVSDSDDDYEASDEEEEEEEDDDDEEDSPPRRKRGGEKEEGSESDNSGEEESDPDDEHQEDGPVQCPHSPPCVVDNSSEIGDGEEYPPVRQASSPRRSRRPTKKPARFMGGSCRAESECLKKESSDSDSGDEMKKSLKQSSLEKFFSVGGKTGNGHADKVPKSSDEGGQGGKRSKSLDNISGITSVDSDIIRQVAHLQVSPSKLGVDLAVYEARNILGSTLKSPEGDPEGGSPATTAWRKDRTGHLNEGRKLIARSLGDLILAVVDETEAFREAKQKKARVERLSLKVTQLENKLGELCFAIDQGQLTLDLMIAERRHTEGELKRVQKKLKSTKRVSELSFSLADVGRSERAMQSVGSAAASYRLIRDEEPPKKVKDGVGEDDIYAESHSSSYYEAEDALYGVPVVPDSIPEGLDKVGH